MQKISEIIARQLKDMYNIAYIQIEEKNYQEAEGLYKTILAMCNTLNYREGMFMAYRSIANVQLLQGRNSEAMDAMEHAFLLCDEGEEKTQIHQLLGKLALYELKQAIDAEKAGELQRAVEIYQKIVLYLGEKRKKIVTSEIELITERLQNGC